MNAKSIAMGVTAMVVAVVLVVTCAVPIISDSVATEDKFTNEGLIRMTKLTTSDTVNASWDHTDPYNFTVNGEKIALPQTLAVWSLTVGGSDNEFMIRYIPNDSTYGTYLTVFSEDYANVSAGTVAETDLTLTINEGSITVTNGTYTNTNSFSDYMFIVSNDGNYIMCNPNSTTYVIDTSDIHGIGRTWLPSIQNNINFNVSGTIKDGFEVDYSGTALDVTISDITVSSTKISNYTNLYQFNNVSFKVGYNSLSDTATYSQVIVPYEVSAERSVHVDGPTGDILAVIPILMVLGIVIGAVALFLTTRRD